MTALTEMKNKLVGAARVQGDQYAGGEERPLRAPFTSCQGTTGPAELKEDVRGAARRPSESW